jgi:diguanylate cyclase (GGDEF)-like protein
MLLIAFICYILSFFFQLFAAYICCTLIFKIAGVFRWAWICLTIGLTLMLSRRIFPAIEIYTTGNYTLIDAVFALIISVFLSGGIFGIAKLIETEKNKNDALSLLSALDPLTNCLSRTEIFSKIADEIDRTLRTGNTFSILEIDIDHFKDVNDRYGHQVGDEVLISLVKSIAESLRNVDILGRIGGEEFLIALPETGEIEALQVAERIRTHIANTPQRTSLHEPLKITVSIGVTTLNIATSLGTNKHELLHELVHIADQAMYLAKNSGRNCSYVL